MWKNPQKTADLVTNLLFVQCKLWFQKNCKLNSKQELSYSKNQLHMSERAKHFTQNQAIFQSSRSAGYCIENNMRNTNWRMNFSLMPKVCWLIGLQFSLNFDIILMFPNFFPDFPGFQLTVSNNLNYAEQFCFCTLFYVFQPSATFHIETSH